LTAVKNWTTKKAGGGGPSKEKRGKKRGRPIGGSIVRDEKMAHPRSSKPESGLLTEM